MQTYKKYRSIREIHLLFRQTQSKPLQETKNGAGTDTPATDHRLHCRYEYKAEYNHENKPYATFTAGQQATARRKLLNQEPLK